MKFQMFGWAVISLYIYIFMANFPAGITKLPTVDSSNAVVTGISQTAYLAGKGVSHVKPNP